ncbi:MAG: flagellar brake protein [Deltaproteobacteria bacterium]|nr:flagellar brake protein [Deltaproteobacteria bacterium]
MATEQGGKSGMEDVLFGETVIAPQFAVGLNMYIQVESRGQKFRTLVNVIGWYRPHFVITTAPNTDKRATLLQTGSELVVRYLLDGTVYGFSSRLIEKLNLPAAMWLLRYPDVVEVKNLRRSPRVQTLIQVETDGAQNWLMMDISKQGALVTMDAMPEVGTRLPLTFVLPDGSKIERIEAEVIRVNQGQEGPSVGVRFHEDDGQIEKVRAFVEMQERSLRRLLTEFDIPGR